MMVHARLVMILQHARITELSQESPIKYLCPFLFFSLTFAAGEVRLDHPPTWDDDTLLLLHFDEPDEAILIADRLVVDPVYVRMEAKYQDGRFGGALKFVGRPGLRQCLLLPLPQQLHRVRHGSKKPTVIARMGDRAHVELDVPVVLTDNQRGYTIEFWVWPQVLADQSIVSGVNTAAYTPEPSWQVKLTAQGRLRFAIGSGLHRFEIESDRQLPIGQWTHVAIVCHEHRFQIHMNGSAASQVRQMETAKRQRIEEPGSDGTAICIGGPGPDGLGGFFDGLIDELRLSKAPRSFERDPAVLIGSQKELFLDDYLIASMRGIKRVVNQPERYTGNPLLRPKGDWEARSLQQMGVIYDSRLGLFRTWYRTNNSTDTQMNMCYAFSRDGLHWDQPELGLVDYEGSTRNNIVMPKRSAFVFLDPLARPGEGNTCATAKLNYGAGRGPFKQVLVRSTDGFEWPWGEVQSMSGYQGWPYSRLRGQQAIMGVDRPLPFDPAYFAKTDKLTLIEKEGEGLKDLLFARIGWDLTHWQNPSLTELQSTEKNNRGWYGIKTRDEESILVGITDAYHAEDLDEGGMKRWRRMGPAGYKREESRWVDFQLISSRDGYHWTHVADQATFFPVGNEGEWDEGSLYYAQVVEPPGSNKLYIYYQGYKIRHDLSDQGYQEWFAKTQQPAVNLGVAFLRKDGYVSLEPDDAHSVGILETKPIRFSGRFLFLNADASRGSIEVELCDDRGNPLSGFQRQEGKPLTTDNLRHRVEWAQNADLGSLAGKVVVVRLYLRQKAKLYSYRFGGPDPHSLER